MMPIDMFMKLVRGGTVSFFAIVAMACTPTAPARDDAAILRLRDVIANPEDYVGRMIVVEGFVHASWGGGTIFASRQAEAEYRSSEGLRLVPLQQLPSFTQADGTLAEVTGVVQTPVQPWGDWPGVITVQKVLPKERFRAAAMSPKEATDMSLEEADELFHKSVEHAERQMLESN